MNSSDAEDCVRLMAKAVHDEICRYTVVIVDLETWEIGSGTLIRIGDRVFVATASHVLCQNPNGRIAVVTEKNGYKHDRPLPTILRSGRKEIQGIDVGYLELDTVEVRDTMRNDVLPIDRVADLTTGDPNRFATLVGSPAERMMPQEDGSRIGAIDSINLQPIAPDMYASRLEPLPPGAPPADPTQDVFLDYSGRDGYIFWTAQKVRFPGIPGMSGGGIWDWHRASHDSLWRVNETRLYAIQSCERERSAKKYLRATQIIHWLKLVRDHYVDLRPLIDVRFPRIGLLDLVAAT
jgi:hypothetical protein